ncbi:MAG: STAS domain-containing protein [Kutzneria sp.]|nr:STAS domain-containing protein [Kutzneria sp.]
MHGPPGPPAQSSTAPLLRVSVEHRGLISLVHVSGDVDASTVDHLARAVRHALAASHAVVLDLQHVTFFAAAGVRLLLQTRQSAMKVNTKLHLVGAKSVMRSLELTGLTGEFTVHDTVAEAVATLEPGRA